MSIRRSPAGHYTVICDVCGLDAHVIASRAILAPPLARERGWHFEGHRKPYGARCPVCQADLEAKP